MIKCKADRHKGVKVRTKGPIADVATEILGIIKVTFMEIDHHNPALAEEFKKQIIGTLIAPDSPIFRKEVL